MSQYKDPVRNQLVMESHKGAMNVAHMVFHESLGFVTNLEFWAAGWNRFKVYV